MSTGVEVNNYYVGDNFELLKVMPDGYVDLIYFDPPFNTGRDFKDFKDQYPSMSSFRDDFLKPRLQQCKRVLKRDAKNKKKMNRFHDSIICYRASAKSNFNPE